MENENRYGGKAFTVGHEMEKRIALRRQNLPEAAGAGIRRCNMIRENTPICSRCGSRRTAHPSGVCSCCRKLKGSKPCIRCGQRKTLAKDGICSICRAALKGRQGCVLTEEQAIQRTERLLSVLRQHRSGRSYAQISEMIGIPRSTVYWKAMRARDMKLTVLELADPDADLEDRLLERGQTEEKGPKK